MASTASDLIKFEKMTTGEKSGTWGTLANVAMSRIEESVHEITNISLASLGGANYTLDDTQYLEHDDASNLQESHVALIKATGTLDAAEQIIVPLRNHIYWVWNGTGGAFAVTIGGATGGTIEVPQGYLAAVICDGTNVEALTPPISVAGVLTMYGRELILDVDGDTSITADTDDQMDFRFGGVDELTLTAAKADNLDDIAALTPTDSNFMVGDGTNWVLEPAATAATSMGLGTGDSPQLTAVNIGHATDTTVARGSAGVITVEGVTVAMLTPVQTWIAAQRPTVTAITSTTNSIALELNTSNDFSHTFTEDTTLANPTSTAIAGQSGSIYLTQHASSPKTLAFGSEYDFAAGTAPTVTATNSARDRLDYVVRADGQIEITAVLAFA